MDLIILFRAFARRKWILILIPLIAGITAFFFTLRTKKQYMSRAQLSTGFTIRDLASINNQDFNMGEADVQFSNLIETLVSNKVIGNTSYQLLIHDLTSAAPFKQKEDLSDVDQKIVSNINKDKIISILKKKLDSTELLNPNLPSERYVLKILKSYQYDYQSIKDLLNVERANRTDYVNVFAKSTNPYLSAFLVNNLCKNFLAYNRSLQTDRSSGSIDTLAKQVEQKRNLYTQKQNELTQLKIQAGVVGESSTGNTKISLMSTFEESLSEERKTLRLSLAQLSDVNNKLSQIGVAAPKNTSAEILRLRDQINDLQLAYQSNRDPQTLKRINELSARRDDLIVNSESINTGKEDKERRQLLLDQKGDLQSQIQASRENINSLESKVAILNSNVSGDAGKEATIKAYEDELELIKNDYTSINEKYNNAQEINTSYRTSGIKQTLIAQPATEPEKSKTMIIVAAAIMATLVLCGIIILLMEYFDFSVRNAANFTKLTKVKTLSAIPIIELTKKDESFIHDYSGNEDRLLTDLLNKLRYEFESSGNKVFLLTSTKNQEGKTTILSLLSGIYTKTNKRVLIIDSNFSNNEITKKFNADQSFREFFMRDMEQKKLTSTQLMTQFDDTIAKTNYKNIDIIGCKEDYILPSEIYPLHNPLNRFKEFTERYDFIFIEGAALNHHSDSKELAKYVDGVILIASATSQIKHQDKESIEYLKSLNGKFMGAILNKADRADLV